MYSPTTLHTAAMIPQVRRIITDLGRRHSGQAACAAFSWFQQRSTGTSPASWQKSCIAACVHNGDIETAESMYGLLLESQQIPSVSVLTVLIVGCCSQGKVDKALQVYHPLWLNACMNGKPWHTGSCEGWQKRMSYKVSVIIIISACSIYNNSVIITLSQTRRATWQ